MKLTELDPRWYTVEGANGAAVGISFDCPHCRTQRLGVAFHHKGHEAMEDSVIHAASPLTNHIWDIEGDTFENLTLTPSVDASQVAGGHWHGHITNGEIK